MSFQENLNRLFVEQARLGDLAGMQFSYLLGPDLYYRNAAALCNAAENGNSRAVHFILSKAVFPQALLAKPLQSAVSHGYTDIVRAVLQARADPDPGKTGEMAKKAFHSGQREIASLLLAAIFANIGKTADFYRAIELKRRALAKDKIFKTGSDSFKNWSDFDQLVTNEALKAMGDPHIFLCNNNDGKQSETVYALSHRRYHKLQSKEFIYLEQWLKKYGRIDNPHGPIITILHPNGRRVEFYGHQKNDLKVIAPEVNFAELSYGKLYEPCAGPGTFPVIYQSVHLGKTDELIAYLKEKQHCLSLNDCLLKPPYATKTLIQLIAQQQKLGAVIQIDNLDMSADDLHKVRSAVKNGEWEKQVSDRLFKVLLMVASPLIPAKPAGHNNALPHQCDKLST